MLEEGLCSLQDDQNGSILFRSLGVTNTPEDADGDEEAGVVTEYYGYSARGLTAPREALPVVVRAANEELKRRDGNSGGHEKEDETIRLGFTLPVGALRCLSRLRGCSVDGELMMLCADNGVVSMSETSQLQRLVDHSLPRFVAYGSLSFPVNFAALKAYAEAQGGFFLSNHLEAEDMAWASETGGGMAVNVGTQWHTQIAPPSPSSSSSSELHKLCCVVLPRWGEGRGKVHARSLLSVYQSTRLVFAGHALCPPHLFFDLLPGNGENGQESTGVGLMLPSQLQDGRPMRRGDGGDTGMNAVATATLRLFHLSCFDPYVFARVASDVLDSAALEDEERRNTFGGGSRNGQVSRTTEMRRLWPVESAARVDRAIDKILSLTFETESLVAGGLEECMGLESTTENYDSESDDEDGEVELREREQEERHRQEKSWLARRRYYFLRCRASLTHLAGRLLLLFRDPRHALSRMREARRLLTTAAEAAAEAEMDPTSLATKFSPSPPRIIPLSVAGRVPSSWFYNEALAAALHGSFTHAREMMKAMEAGLKQDAKIEDDQRSIAGAGGRKGHRYTYQYHQHNGDEGPATCLCRRTDNCRGNPCSR